MNDKHINMTLPNHTINMNFRGINILQKTSLKGLQLVEYIVSFVFSKRTANFMSSHTQYSNIFNVLSFTLS